ncbi:MAG: glycerol-3-phosphate 1-O-acyltransferase [Bacteroidetes bacterium]|jgi:acyl phosphate:glycerol-3-phosphate acyltransferase|nr:glycerol-3-phosphate 1-O-acyltransferase [Bacteroidota bacterium]
MLEITFALLAYLLGSIPSAIWVGKRFYGIDVREHGSGNAGATNVFRVLGKVPGTIVLVLDILKGYMAVRLADVVDFLSKDGFSNLALSHTEVSGLVDGDYKFLMILFGTMSVVGHLIPIFAKFKGGKGVATLFGMLIALNPAVAGLALAVFVITNIITGYVSIGSLLAGLSIPFLFIRVFGETDLSILIFSFLVAGLILVTHRKNIKRLIAGEEAKTRIVMKQKK